jgi:hypothetical protein
MTAEGISLYAYIQTYYKGKYYNHAPHRTPDLLSLGTCVNVTRRVAKEGDWVMGLLPVNGRPDGRRLVSFLFRIDVDGIIQRADYFNIPNYKERFDNYYLPQATRRSSSVWSFTESMSNGEFQLQPNKYHNDDIKDKEGREDIRKDMKSHNVLLSHTFHMFEPDMGCPLPPDWVPVEKGFSKRGGAQGHRKLAVTNDRMLKLLEYLRN